MEKVIKNLPIFWTFIRENGVATIHQVKFRGLYSQAIFEGKFKIDFAVFNIAGRSELFVGYGGEYGIRTEGGRKLFNLEYIFPTKELAEEAAQNVDKYGRVKLDPTKQVFKQNGGNQYIILPNNPLYGQNEWWWGNNAPSNMKAHKCSSGAVKLCGWRWDGLATRFVCAFMEHDIELVDGIVYPNYGCWPVYDMVSCEWVGKFDFQYYSSKEECEKANCTKVFVFDD